MIGSVRWRLTVAVSLVVGAVAITAALLAPRQVEQGLIDDRLDAEIPVERAALATDVPVFGSLSSPELTALYGPELAELASSLESVGVLDELRAFRDDRTVIVEPLPGIVGMIEADGQIRVDDRSTGAPDGPLVTGQRLQSLAEDFDEPTLFDGQIQILADGSIDDLLASLAERFEGGEFDRLDFGEFERIGGELFGADFFENLPPIAIEDDIGPLRPAEPPASVDQLVFGTRNVDGVDVIVTASGDGIELTVERLRNALWAAVPIAILLTGLVTWLLAGRALRPVRAITEQTGRIRAGALHERVPVPSSSDEIAGLAREMNDLLARLDHDDRRRRQFVADASHELRSPLASIQTQAEVAITEPDADASELAEGVLAETQRLGTIVDDLLTLARHDEAMPAPGAIVDLDDVVLTVASRVRRVPVDTSCVSGGRVRGHRDAIARVVTHLLDNAARHASTRVRITLGRIDDRVVLAVDDDGPGISPVDRDRVFERFVRLDEARVRDVGGAGLGLAVVAATVRAMGGTVEIDTSDLGGAGFRVSLPATD